MIPYKFIPPKDNDIDFNEEIDRIIEERLELGFTEDDILHQNLFDMPDEDADIDDPDDLKYVL